MAYKYGDIIRLKDGAMPQMSLDKETFFNLPDQEDENSGEHKKGNGDKCNTYWGLPEEAFETDDMGFVYLKSECAKRFAWGVDDVAEIDDCFGVYEYDRLNISVAFDPEGIVNAGAFCSFVNDCDIIGDDHKNTEKNFKKYVGITF
jgi:hypothetical protein